jgi:hypothetical protein
MLRSKQRGGIAMARNTRVTPYDEAPVGTFDEDACVPEFMVRESTPLMVMEDYAQPENPMPLFLSDVAERPRQRGFGTGGGIGRNEAMVWPRIFKAGIVVASAAAIAFAIVSVDDPLALFSNAKASLLGSSTDQPGVAQQSTPQPAAAVQLASSGPPTPVAQPPNGARALSPAMAAPVAPARRLNAADVAALLKRARGLIAIGDIVPARLLLERAADAQEAGAALLLAQTYDPAVLGKQDMRSITPDPAAARDWYQRAARLGSLDARQRLVQMQN